MKMWEAQHHCTSPRASESRIFVPSTQITPMLLWLIYFLLSSEMFSQEYCYEYKFNAGPFSQLLM